MGIFSQISNRKKKTLEKHTLRRKRMDKAYKKALKGPAAIDIQDAELLSSEMLKNKLKNPRNNINLSNKKRKTILKRLKHRQVKEKEDEDDEEDDFDMADKDEMSGNSDSKVAVVDPKTSEPSTSAAPTTSKRRKRGGKKRRKGKGPASEDVEMQDNDL